MKKLLLVLFASSALIACDSGGGGFLGGTDTGGGGNSGGSGGGGGPTTSPREATGDIVGSDLTLQTRTGRLNTITGQIGSDQIRYNARTRILTVNGKEPVRWEAGGTYMIEQRAPFGALFGSYVDDSGNSRSFATLVHAPGLYVEDDGLRNTGWVNVPYSYVTSGVDMGRRVTEGTNGTIDVSGTNWEAQFGDVTLDGTRRVGEVTGKATLGEMDGEFEGVDGILELPSGDYYVTNGAFAGDNGEDRNFAGVWENFVSVH